MSLISSKPSKKHELVDPILVVLTLILILMVFIPADMGNYNSFGSVLESFNRAPTTNISFSSDLQYWDANCSHGWTTDSACTDISARAQSCSIGLDSAYCSEYASYLQQFGNK
jgi:hypothetical protein